MAQVRELTYIFPVVSPLYSRDILRLAAGIPHLGRLQSPQGRTERSSPVCGSRVVVEVRLDAQGRVAELAQEVRACALGQAAAALMGRHAAGRSAGDLERARDDLSAFLTGASETPGDWPGLDVFAAARAYPARHAAILLPFDALAQAAAEARATVSAA